MEPLAPPIFVMDAGHVKYQLKWAELFGPPISEMDAGLVKYVLKWAEPLGPWEISS